MKLKNEIELLSGILKDHDKELDSHFPIDENQVPAFAKAQYLNLFSMVQEVVGAIELMSHLKKAPKKALDILVTNINEHIEMVNEVMEDTDYLHWTDEEDEHYTGVFYYDLHKTIEETIEEMKEVKKW